MNKTAWQKFSAARDQYRNWVEKLGRSFPELRALQQELADCRSGPAYTVETPVVYNGALDDLGPGDEIRLILVADNPGRREQAAENRRYLVGPSGKIAEKFFRDHPELGVDFRKNAIILNKTPIHTPRTVELRELCRRGDGPDKGGPGPARKKGPAFSERLAETQEFMARLLLDFHRALRPVPVWITGYSEMKPGGVFGPYIEALRKLYGPAGKAGPPAVDSLFFYRHFSMNQFTIDLRRQSAPGETVPETLARIGSAYRLRILGW
ncbi:MAG: hypothetical protein LBK27_03345 [Treponema sp.]|jgi:hypothetical protein|nr:hypothetical protein [Treponema sp.]